MVRLSLSNTTGDRDRIQIGTTLVVTHKRNLLSIRAEAGHPLCALRAGQRHGCAPIAIDDPEIVGIRKYDFVLANIGISHHPARGNRLSRGGPTNANQADHGKWFGQIIHSCLSQNGVMIWEKCFQATVKLKGCDKRALFTVLATSDEAQKHRLIHRRREIS